MASPSRVHRSTLSLRAASAADFWGRLSQSMAFIDGSTRSSSADSSSLGGRGRAACQRRAQAGGDRSQQETWHHVFAEGGDWELRACLPPATTSASVLLELTAAGADCRVARRLSTPADLWRAHARKPSSWEESSALQRRRSALLVAARRGNTAGRGAGNTAGRGAGNAAFLVLPAAADEDKRDARYFFQHPYSRLCVTYLVIFCNFLLFAEDPISHSHTESDIPVVGNVFSFVLTKYPPEWRWSVIKVLTWLLAMMCGMILGKLIIHGILFSQILRLKMFRDDQGSWMTMFLTVIVSLYMFSHAYNLLLFLWYNDASYQINSHMGVTNASLMKAAACSTWLGDLVTALMVTDMMLQDTLYPLWAPRLRALWRRSDLPRILVFWVGSVLATAVVVTLIVSDWISWDHLNKDFLSTTELSRAFLASSILVMDLLIVMQDWDFPHFTTTLHVNLPGFNVATLKWKYAEVDITGKWFNYGIIVMVTLLDLNMWKNQIIYDPAEFGQYTGCYRPGRQDPHGERLGGTRDRERQLLDVGEPLASQSRHGTALFLRGHGDELTLHGLPTVC
ncbi:transmembrane protein 117-like isoform X2 [Bacillus rossius redtenbacheri]|uniref:transmembrane protein 117-like isoform X2 n=1 Tax=Bacillus rossius redtenbacheri TaxID=93214 RepID=UPI002FDF05D6